MQPSTYTNTAPSPIQSLLKTLLRAISRVEQKTDVRDELDEAGLLLESLPLSTEEFGLARNRLWSARRFVRSGEYGAAHWELRTLRMTFSRQEKEVTVKSRPARWTR